MSHLVNHVYQKILLNENESFILDPCGYIVDKFY